MQGPPQKWRGIFRIEKVTAQYIRCFDFWSLRAGDMPTEMKMQTPLAWSSSNWKVNVSCSLIQRKQNKLLAGEKRKRTKIYWMSLYIILWRRQWQPTPVLLAWKIPWMEEPGRLQSMGSLRVRHDWATSLLLFTFMHWRRKWQPTPVFLPGESQRRQSLVGCRLWGHTEWDMTEAT